MIQSEIPSVYAPFPPYSEGLCGKAAIVAPTDLPPTILLVEDEEPLTRISHEFVEENPGAIRIS